MEFWNEIWVTLRRNTWRSVMTMFGVFWGIWMLIVLCGLGNGVSNAVLPGADKIPSNVAFFFPGETTMPYHGFQTGRSWRTRLDDIESVRRHLGTKAKSVGGLLWGMSTTFSNGDQHGDYQQRGMTPQFLDTQPLQVIYGRFINDIDLKHKRKVCVIGQEVYETLFPQGGDPCGTRIKAGSLYFTVVGVVKKGSGKVNIGGNMDKTVMMPLTTVQQMQHRGKDVDMIHVTFANNCPASQYQGEVESLLKLHHHISPDDKGAIWIFNLQEIFDTFRLLFFGINVLLWIVGLGALLSGLIGISNIMLVTVKERTQEIGIRRAIGAKPRLILSQIMCESLTLTAAAGITGLVSGVWTVVAIDMATDGTTMESDGALVANPSVSFALATGALMLVIAGGLLAGLMPAIRAMKIKAIDALRDE